MKFGLVNNVRVEATKRARGICPYCGSELIARCGPIKIHHWAHKSKHKCDHHWEPETPWHRFWKNNYSSEWQEIIFIDNQTGEKHIADVVTDYNLVLEFQHSHIDSQERISREMFYQNMTWVVDGTRLKRDYPRFQKEISNFRHLKYGAFLVDDPAKCFPSSWLYSAVPVVFDFIGTDVCRDLFDERSHLYCLLPYNLDGSTILLKMERDVFIKLTRESVWLAYMHEWKTWEEKIKAHREKKKILEINRQSLIHTQMLINSRRRGKGPQYVLERGKRRKRYPRL